MTEHNGTSCDCSCHDGPTDYYACSTIGGCGSTWQPPEPESKRTVYETIDGEQACILGCIDKGEHKPACPCHDACPDHVGHCKGCAPRPAHDYSLLCGKCYYVKLVRPLRRAPALYDWLASRKSGLQATAYDDILVSTTKDPPLPFNPAIDDHLTLVTRMLASWCRQAATQADPGPGPDSWEIDDTAKWLGQHAGWISDQPWCLTLMAHLKGHEQRARQLAPWQATRHALPLPCLKCEEQTLVLFGGEDWVTCTNPDCDQIIGWYRYERLSRAVAGVREQEVG